MWYYTYYIIPSTLYNSNSMFNVDFCGSTPQRTFVVAKKQDSDDEQIDKV